MSHLRCSLLRSVPLIDLGRNTVKNHFSEKMENKVKKNLNFCKTLHLKHLLDIFRHLECFTAINKNWQSE